MKDARKNDNLTNELKQPISDKTFNIISIALIVIILLIITLIWTL